MNGGFSPLEGFLNQSDISCVFVGLRGLRGFKLSCVRSVVDSLRLADSTLSLFQLTWTSAKKISRISALSGVHGLLFAIAGMAMLCYLDRYTLKNPRPSE
jgi:hypothetical protein